MQALSLLKDINMIYTPLFSLGRTLATPYAKEELERLNYSPLDLLRKHMSGDWSEMDVEDQQSNQDAIGEGSRIFSAYIIQGTKFWVITEADRSSTTILLPSEY
jgi:hypothetical protein